MRRFVLILGTVAAAACGAGAAPASGSSTAPVQQSRDPNVVTAQELAATGAGDLYSAIQRTRPTFLQTRGTATFGNSGPEVIKVYVENMERGDLSVLREINTLDVQEVRHLSAPEATQRFGTGVSLGAILVTLKK
jgi:hypothetical protein